MSIPWLDLFRAATAGESSGPTILSLATVDSEGHPHVRSVVCRRIGDDGSLWIASDARSAKHEQLADRPEAAAVCWLASSREQFRFVGKVELLGASSIGPEREGLWRRMTPETRAMFFWPPPGEPRLAADVAFAHASDAPSPPDSFEIVVLHPQMAEHLQLSVLPHRRRRWVLRDEWRCEELNP